MPIYIDNGYLAFTKSFMYLQYFLDSKNNWQPFIQSSFFSCRFNAHLSCPSDWMLMWSLPSSNWFLGLFPSLLKYDLCEVISAYCLDRWCVYSAFLMWHSSLDWPGFDLIVWGHKVTRLELVFLNFVSKRSSNNLHNHLVWICYGSISILKLLYWKQVIQVKHEIIK